MKISIEKVEKLIEKTGISYKEAKKVLEKTNGDLLDAVILLEKEGKINSSSGNYSTSNDVDNEEKTKDEKQNSKHHYHDESTDFGDLMNKFWKFTCKVCHNGIVNNFDVYRHDNRIVHIPILALIVLLIFCFWIILPLLVIGLFFSCRYRFSGPHLEREELNKVMDSATDKAESVKQSIKEAAENEKAKERERHS